MAGSVRSMLRIALRGSSWSRFFAYASPALFDVIPARDLISQSRELFSNRRDAESFNQVRDKIGGLLQRSELDVELTDGPRAPGETGLADLPESNRQQAGQRILEIYFMQVFAGPEALLDLRGEKFTRSEQGGLRWRPGALYVHWEPEFLQGVRSLYTGFYLGDEAQFEVALRLLQIEGSGGLLRNLLGQDDPRRARFSTKTFHTNFHELFVSFRDRGLAIHRNFLPLGVCLMSLYDSLDALGVELDVFDAVVQARIFAA